MGGKSLLLTDFICHTYRSMIKLGTVIEGPKTIISTSQMSSADVSIFQQKSAVFIISRNTDIGCILMQSLFKERWL